jgi:hypothetical protein
MRGHEIKIETMVECGNSQKCQKALIGPSGGSDLLATALRGLQITFRLNREIQTNSICQANDAEPLLEVAHQVKLSSDRYRPLS